MRLLDFLLDLPGVEALAGAAQPAPLAEGSLEDGTIRCPWHGSRFRLADGTVAEGPATRPVPAFETRVRDGRIQLRIARARP